EYLCVGGRAGGRFRDRARQGCRARASRDGFTVSPGSALRPGFSETHYSAATPPNFSRYRSIPRVAAKNPKVPVTITAEPKPPAQSSFTPEASACLAWHTLPSGLG